ncbi:MAG: acyl-CoA dehydrogenase [Acidimicrobiales bacterium]|nr:acyl-CoA dehydrogenase [Acidimicrobiales bacterium]
MDFDDTPEEAAFRAEALAWLEAHAAPRDLDTTRPSMGGFGDEYVRQCQQWQRTLYDGGWAGITWPKEYGGRGGTGRQAGIFSQEQAKFDVSNGVFAVGIGMVGPTLMAHATDAQKERYLGPMLRGEEIWCQLFSEPGAGSDLAGLSTKAVRDGDEWLVNGQKVWTSGAQHSTFGILMTRTDPDAPKHEGITYFVVDMATPGIDVRPLRQITGVAHFNEVFLTDVRVPNDNVVGEPNGGWRVAVTTMAHERALIGGGVGLGFRDVLRLARSCGRTDDGRVRQALATAYGRFEVLKFLGYRVQTAASQGRPPGPESSVMKLAYSQHLAALADLVLSLEGAAGMLNGDDAPDAGQWQQHFLNQWSSRIGGGTDQIQRNVIGERVLGLPREPRVDKDVPFRAIPG